MNKEKLEKLKIETFSQGLKVDTIPFTYAEEKGFSQILGWKIVAFSKEDSKDCLAVLSFEEIVKEPLLAIGNNLLREIDSAIFFGDDFAKVTKALGTPLFQDEVYKGMVRYYYKQDSLLIVVGIAQEKMISLEIVTDPKLMQTIVSYRN